MVGHGGLECGCQALGKALPAVFAVVEHIGKALGENLVVLVDRLLPFFNRGLLHLGLGFFQRGGFGRFACRFQLRALEAFTLQLGNVLFDAQLRLQLRHSLGPLNARQAHQLQLLL